MVEGKDILESGVDLHNKCLLRVKSRLFLSLTLTQKGPQLFSTSFPLISAVLHICSSALCTKGFYPLCTFLLIPYEGFLKYSCSIYILHTPILYQASQ